MCYVCMYQFLLVFLFCLQQGKSYKFDYPEAGGPLALAGSSHTIGTVGSMGSIGSSGSASNTGFHMHEGSMSSSQSISSSNSKHSDQDQDQDDDDDEELAADG